MSTKIEKQRLIIDTDCGNDDMFAICMLFLCPNIEIIAFTVTTGVSLNTIGFCSVKEIFRIFKKGSYSSLFGISRKIG